MSNNNESDHFPNPQDIEGLRILPDATNVLVIAPHGPFQKTKSGKLKYRNDFKTGLIADAIHKDKGWFTIINDKFIKPDVEKNEVPDFSVKRLDLFKTDQAKMVPGYLETIKYAVDSTEGKTLVIWLHGMADNSAASQQASHIKAKKMKRADGDLHALIGYGQGRHPRIKEQKRLKRATKQDEESLPTAQKDTVEKFRDRLTQLGLRTLITMDKANDFRGRDPKRLNQWFLNQGYSLDDVESFQIEIREKGFRKTLKQCTKTATIIANALAELVPASEEVLETVADAPPAGVTESSNYDTVGDTEVSPMTEETMDAVPDAQFVQRDAEARRTDALLNEEADRQDTSEAESIDGEATSIEPVDNENPSTAPGTNTPVTPEDKKVADAFEELKSIFHKHFHNAMVEAGQYIITKFYDGDPVAALAKNNGKEQPQSISKLIRLLRAASEQPKGDIPSLAWFYNAVNLAAHEAICEQERLQTFGKLGHSHKLQLLHVPKLKGIPADEIKKDISDIFEEKEQLAEYAYKNALSVRDFKKYIKDQSSSAEIDLTALPSLTELKKMERSDLVKLRNQANGKITENQRLIALYGKSIQKLDSVLSESGDNFEKGKGRFRDWTKPGNNVNICTGCDNDCLYCYAKSMAQRWNQVNPEEWSQMRIRQTDVDKPRRLHDGLVGFPTSHDITPTNIDAYLIVLGKLLRAGNEVLIVTKPCFDCIKAICDASPFFKDKILFRFTIGAMDNDILGFWEPNAPTFEERRESLRYAHEQGFRTSVSMEPMIDTVQIEQLIEELRPLVFEDIWLGTMNHLKEIKKGGDDNLIAEVAKVEAGQSPEILTALYSTYEDDPLIKWKTDAFKIITEAAEKEFEHWEKLKIKNDSGVEKDAIAPVIISATRRSDIPTWHSDWFMERLRRGHLLSTHMKWQYVSFAKTRLIIFWTKNPRPMLKHLDELDEMGIGYYFTYTLTDYDQEGLERHLPALQDRIHTFRELSDKIGKEKVIWRFDPLVLTDAIDRDTLLGKVESVMKNLAGYTEKLVFSFFDPFARKRVERNLNKRAEKFRNFSAEDKAYIARNISEMAVAHNMQAATCSEAMALSKKYEIVRNKCIDDDLIRRVFNQDSELMSFVGLKGLEHFVQGDHCGCIRSFDIGKNNTCRNGCVYCYANVSQKAVQNNFRRLSKDGETLLKAS